MPEIDEITLAVRSVLGEMMSPETAHRLAKALRPTHGREAVEDVERDARSFDLRWKADMRAIKRWQEAHPGKDLVWPDHADLCVWLLDEVDRLRSRAEPSEIPMTEIDTGKLREIASSATPGPWFQTGKPWFDSQDGVLAGSPDGNVAYFVTDCDVFGREPDEYEGPFQRSNPDVDAAFIAAANPSTVLRAPSRPRPRWPLGQAHRRPDPTRSPLPRSARRSAAVTDRIPISSAKQIGEIYAYDQVIIYARRVGEPGLEWVTTWGKDHTHCATAARIGDAIGRQVAKPIEERDAEIARLRELLRRAGEVVTLACTGEGWGKALAWIVNGAPSNEDGVAAAKKIVSIQTRADAIAREIEEALK